MRSGRRRRSSRGLLPSTSGQSLVEFVLALPVLLLVAFGIFEFGQYYHTRLSIRNAVAEGARFAITGNQLPDPETGDPLDRAQSIERVILERTQRFGVVRDDISISPADGGDPEEIVTIRLDYAYRIGLPSVASVLSPGSLDFSVRTSMRNEPFIP
ncbi:MAG: TadE/TadG family type IV pilus assembly protein [Gemmatimonadota bacterium]